MSQVSSEGRFRAVAVVAALLIAVVAAWVLQSAGVPQPPADETPGPVEPDDAFFRQRAFPVGRIDGEALRQAARDVASRLPARTTGTGWRFAGPTNVSGRVTALAVESFDRFTVGTATGGLFQTSDGGASFTAVGGDAFTAPVGALALDPSDPGTLYVGTGEANGGGGSVAFEGSGVWRTRDGGASFEPLGLERTASIGRLAVDPTDPDVLLVAAMGALYTDTPDRGVYRSDDGGASWTQTLFVDEGTGAIDLAIHPTHPDTVFAATWERSRRLERRDYGGPGSGVWRSADGGRTWAPLAGGLPTGDDVGRIGLSIAASRPSTVYAAATDATGFLSGLYRSDDGGDTWARQPGSVFSPSYGWWFGQVRVDPTDWRTVYLPWFELGKSTDGGASFFDANGGMHVDHHALWIDPSDPDRLIAGNDGGVYRSETGGDLWRAAAGLPSTQFYTVDADRGRLVGGTQDNGTVLDTGGTPMWTDVFGGDGQYTRFDPSDPDVLYVSYQYGNFLRTSPDGGGARFISPNASRWNWSAPLELSPFDPSELYVGSDRVHRSRDRGETWTVISPSLAPGGAAGNLVYKTITTISASPAAPGVLWAGTDTGRVWRTTDDGDTWVEVSAGLPERWITRVTAHPTRSGTAAVTVSGFRWAESAAQVFRTDDGGATWTPLADGLPDAPANDVLFLPTDDGLAVATDVGVFLSTGGAGWAPLASGLPVVPVTDLDLDGTLLAAATYGRGVYTVDLGTVTTASAPPAAVSVRVGPNPTRSAVSIRVAPARPGPVEVAVFDVRGRRLATLYDGTLASERVLRWVGDRVPAGVYVVRVTAGGRTVSRRVTVLAR
ncbi:T9SS type A sorting domain-containing protein [Rubrivirga sp. IMCC43871]|uniref:T9SS type A sorting domain-containing protein n=1 Tax=Rubrivirga sp. IMCC43871 TaxID=3391575 RepID=UPI00398FA122